MDFLSSQYFSAVNTHFDVGPAFYGPPPRRHKTRVDYICVPTATLHNVRRCHIQYSAADRLQLINDIARRDHLPLQIDIEVGLAYEHSPATAKFMWDKTRLVEDALHGTGREYLFQRVDRHLQSALANIPSMLNPDKMWHVFNSAIRDAAVDVYQLPAKKVVSRPTDTAEAIDNMLEAKNSLVSYQTICLGHGRGRLDGGDTVFLQQSLHDMLHVWKRLTVFRKARQAVDTCTKRDAQNRENTLLRSLRLHGGFVTCIRYGKFRDCCREKGWARNVENMMFLNLCDWRFPNGRTSCNCLGHRVGVLRRLWSGTRLPMPRKWMTAPVILWKTRYDMHVKTYAHFNRGQSSVSCENLFLLGVFQPRCGASSYFRNGVWNNKGPGLDTSWKSPGLCCFTVLCSRCWFLFGCTGVPLCVGNVALRQSLTKRMVSRDLQDCDSSTTWMCWANGFTTRFGNGGNISIFGTTPRVICGTSRVSIQCCNKKCYYTGSGNIKYHMYCHSMTLRMRFPVQQGKHWRWLFVKLQDLMTWSYCSRGTGKLTCTLKQEMVYYVFNLGPVGYKVIALLADIFLKCIILLLTSGEIAPQSKSYTCKTPLARTYLMFRSVHTRMMWHDALWLTAVNRWLLSWLTPMTFWIVRWVRLVFNKMWTNKNMLLSLQGWGHLFFTKMSTSMEYYLVSGVHAQSTWEGTNSLRGAITANSEHVKRRLKEAFTQWGDFGLATNPYDLLLWFSGQWSAEWPFQVWRPYFSVNLNTNAWILLSTSLLERFCGVQHAKEHSKRMDRRCIERCLMTMCVSFFVLCRPGWSFAFEDFNIGSPWQNALIFTRLYWRPCLANCIGIRQPVSGMMVVLLLVLTHGLVNSKKIWSHCLNWIRLPSGYMASEIGFSLYSQIIGQIFWLLIVLSSARLSFPFVFLLLASSSPCLRVRSNRCRIRWVARWKSGSRLPVIASAKMAVHARLLLGPHKRWLCISEELKEVRMDMCTHMCAQLCVINVFFASMYLRASGPHKITYAILFGCFGVLVRGASHARRLSRRWFWCAPSVMTRNRRSMSCYSASRSISHKCRGLELYSVVFTMSWFQQAQEGARPVKQQRVQDDEGLASKEKKMLEMLAKLCLKNSLEIRELQSAILCTFIVPRDSAIAVAGSDAAKNHVERMKAVQGNERKIDALGPIHVHVWASIVNAAVGSAATKEDADILKEHFDSITKPGSDPNSIALHVHVARFSKAWDKGTVKLHLACRSDWCTVFESLERALVASGAKRKLGQAPRGGLERQIRELLDALQ